MASRRKTDVCIIGPGNWGTSLAAALASAGMPAREIVAQRRRRGQSSAVGWRQAKLDARILWLCVPDSAISEAAAEIVRRRRDLRGQIVVHSSGALTVDVLEPVRRAGAAVASVHPAMTFPTRHAVSLSGVLFGVETPDAAARCTLDAVVRRLGGRPFNVSSKNKALYHAAGTLASPLLVVELAAAIETAHRAGLRPRDAIRWVESLASATFGNVFSRGPARSFSGPFARGDAGTIELHLQALQQHPILAGLYRSLAVCALESLPVQNSRALEKALNTPGKLHAKRREAALASNKKTRMRN
jgi:predicted short-subunit dehydrogenase-like oxidoreductase (DUF2520 family)